MSDCANHSGVLEKIDGLEKWRSEHTEEHRELSKKLDRLPNWAVFFISGMTATIGYLVALIR